MPHPRTLLLIAILALASPLAGCQSIEEMFISGEILSYEEFIAFDKADGWTAQQVIDRLGPPYEVEEREGKRVMLAYNAYSMLGHLRTAEFYFDSQERMRKQPQLW